MVPSVWPIVCSLAHRVFDFFLLQTTVVRFEAALPPNLLKPPLSNSAASVIIPLHDRILVVRLLHGAEFSGQLSEVAQTLDPIFGIQFFAGGRGSGERRPSGTV